jgi:DNA recombination protein RmuC
MTMEQMVLWLTTEHVVLGLGAGALVQLTLLLILLWRRQPAAALTAAVDRVAEGHERIERALRDEVGRAREENSTHARQQRDEVSGALKNVTDSTINAIGHMTTVQQGQLAAFSTQLATLTERHEFRMEALRGLVETKLTELRDDNTQQLERMRVTVDEKLHATLEQRLGETFRLVSERLEQVHRGLGEMQALANGVGDLKRVLSNVKTRGTWGEIQLGILLEQILSPAQYAANVATRPNSNERVEFAVKLPGGTAEEHECLWLPIDAKFPLEDFQRLGEAQDRADADAVLEAGKRLEAQIKSYAKAIREKYISPPNTTDFGIMYLPTEGLYAEVVRRAGLIDVLQRDHRVVVAGPTTLAALLNSLQMGFRTLAVEQRSSEVWALLGAVKTEFGRFGVVLDKVQKKLGEASNTIETAAQRSRVIERRLKGVQELPGTEARTLLGPDDAEVDAVDDTDATIERAAIALVRPASGTTGR